MASALDVIAEVAASGGQILPDPAPTYRLLGSGPHRPVEMRVMEDGTFTIYLPSNTTERRDRFTIAHNLGHVALHTTPGRPSLWYRYSEGAAEVEADRYAFELLMPDADFIDVYDRSGGDTNLLADMFEVSRSAACARARMLRLVAPAA